MSDSLLSHIEHVILETKKKIDMQADELKHSPTESVKQLGNVLTNVAIFSVYTEIHSLVQSGYSANNLKPFVQGQINRNARDCQTTLDIEILKAWTKVLVDISTR